VAVKVQRPGIREMVETDLYILEVLARRLKERSDFAAIYDLPNLVRHLKVVLVREMDFKREARNMVIARNNLAGLAEYHIPDVHLDLTTQHVLTMELVTGAKLKDMGDIPERDRKILASRGMALTVRQILRDGFFHADPHPGNLLILPGNVISLLDWGMVGRLTRSTRADLIELMQAVIAKDGEAILDSLQDILEGGENVDARTVEREILDILDTYVGVSIHHFDMRHFLLDITSLFRQQGFRIPPDLAIMIKALVTAEGTALRIDPDLDIIREAEPQIRALGLIGQKTGAVFRSLSRTVKGLLRFQQRLPRRVSNILDQIENGDLAIRFRHENLNDLYSTLDSVSNRLVLGMIIGGLVIGSSMIVTTGAGPMLWGYPALGVIGFLVSGGLGLWLVFNILRSRRY
jgi:ubiquinone biosynthesis protein